MPDNKDEKQSPYPYPYPYPYKTESPSPYKFDKENPGKYPYPTPNKEEYPDYPYPKSLCKYAPSCPVSDELDNMDCAKDCVHALKFGCPIFLIYFNEFEKFEDINGVELFEIGQDATKKYTSDDLKEIVKNYEELKDVHEPPIAVLGHDEDQKLLRSSGLPAAGWISKLYVKGKKLLGDFSEVPSQIKKLMMSGAYKKRSCEIYPNFSFGEKNYGKVLRRVAFLGFDIPKVKGLADICSRYQEGENQEVDTINVVTKFAERGKESYLKRKKRIMEELDIKDPDKIYMAIEKAYMGEKLTDFEKKILQTGWPELHGEIGEEFRVPKHSRYPYQTAYPYPEPKTDKNSESEDSVSYDPLNIKFEDIEDKIILEGYPYSQIECLSELGIDMYGRPVNVFDEEFLQHFSAASKDWEKRIKKIQDKTNSSLLEIHIALGRSQGLWRGTGVDILSDQDKEILQAGWPEIYGKHGAKFVFRKTFAEEPKGGWTEEQLKMAEPILQIVKEAEKGNEKIEFEVDTAEIVELFFDVVKRRKTDPGERERLILQTIWPQYFGDPNTKFKYSESKDDKVFETNSVHDLLKNGLAALTSLNKLKIPDFNENEALLLFSECVTGKNKSIDQEKQMFLQTGWPDIFGKPGKTFIYPEPTNLELNSEEIQTFISNLNIGEESKMPEEKKKEEGQTEAIQKFSEELAKLKEELGKRDEEIKARDDKIKSLETFTEEQNGKIEFLEQARENDKRQAHLTDVAMFTENLKRKGLAPAFVDDGGLIEFMISLDSKTPVKFSEEDDPSTHYDKFCELMKTMVDMNEKEKLFVPLKKLEKYEENHDKDDSDVPEGIDEDGLKMNQMIQKFAEDNKISFEEAFKAKNWTEELKK